jgi:ribonuclease BN (tRNA processing enzyme)
VKPFSLTCFGTGDGWPDAELNHAAFLYKFGRNALLVDCGEPFDRNYKRSGLGYEVFDGILLSHMHSDHVGGFFMLMQSCWLEKRRKALPVFMPGKAIPALRQMLRTVFIFDELLPFRLGFKALRTGHSQRVGRVRIQAFPTSHLDGFRKHFQAKYTADFRAYSFLLESGRKRVAHSGDLGCPEDLEPLLQKPLDLLVCELAHFSPESIFSYLSGRRIKRLVFVHLARHHREHLAETRKLAAAMLPNISQTFACDGEVVTF